MPSDELISEAPRIESSDMNLQDLLKDFYCVPDFQREYVWTEEDVDRFLQDVYDEFYEAEGGPIEGPEYFIGSIVACNDDEGIFQLIDGQQRMTTIYLILCAIRDHLKTLNSQPSEVLDGCIRSVVLSATFEEVSRYRLVLQYDDSHDVLEQIARGDTEVEDIPDATRSIEQIKEAYGTARDFLRSRFGEEPKAVRQFFGVFMKRVKLIRIVTPRLSHALKVFETINDRGVGLTAMDLLKNLLFMQTPQSKHDKLKRQWKDFATTLEDVREKPLRFLRYFVMAQYEDDWHNPLRAEQIYDWFRRNTSACGIGQDPMGFTKLLQARASVYANYLNHKDPHGRPNHHLRNASIVGGRAARQHMILLLAGQHLDSDTFNILARYVENLLFCYIVTRESTKTLERHFAQWAQELRAVHDGPSLEAFLDAHIRPEIAAREKSFEFALRELTLTRIQNYKMKYILAKLTQHIEREAWGNAAHESLDLYTDKKVEIEHILPQKPTVEVRDGFDKPEEYHVYKQRLGNLTLLEKTLNVVNRNRSFAEKVEGYKQSAFLLTRALHEKPSAGQNTALNRAVASLPEFDGWDSEAIQRRQEVLVDLAKRVWLDGISDSD